MSFHTWHNYGYGICVDDIPTPSVERLSALLHLAPVFEKAVNAYLNESGITEPSIEDYFAYDDDYRFGLATFLKNAIEEAENVSLMACDDFEGRRYLLYQPGYPWELTEREFSLTEETIRQMFQKYLSVITEKRISMDYRDPENGG